jgi:hypothetical protein
MILYHRTPDAAAIIRDGFRDAVGRYLTSSEHSGVWFSDVPLDANEGAQGQQLLTLDIPEELILEFEWKEEPLTEDDCQELDIPYEGDTDPLWFAEKPNREFLVPASLANQFGPPTQIE